MICFPHGWYKCSDIRVKNNHRLCRYGSCLDDYSGFLTVQVKNYKDRNLEFEYFKELHQKFKNKNVKQACYNAFAYSNNPDVFIGSILGYINLKQWKEIDKQELYEIEITHKAIDDKLI